MRWLILGVVLFAIVGWAHSTGHDGWLPDTGTPCPGYDRYHRDDYPC